MKKLLLLLFIPIVCFGQEDIDYTSRIDIINYFNNTKDPVEGLWRGNYVGEVVIIKNNLDYSVIYRETKESKIRKLYSTGDTLATFKLSIDKPLMVGETIKINSCYTSDCGCYNEKDNECKFILPSNAKIFLKNRGYLEKTYYLQENVEFFEYVVGNDSLKLFKGERDMRKYSHPSDFNIVRLFPKKLNNKTNDNKNKIVNTEWAGNGSGIIISKSGYIVTNHHVIEGADDIEVEFIVNDEVQKFNAEIVQSDKVNDLAIIKIFDMNFDGLDNLPYNFNARSSEVGTKVYAYGYPMALSLMGKEIKVTDGMINSKTGYEGNVTTYQITAPIQPGNSGGPLFDEKGNFIGINSAGLNKDVADNVGYTIKSSYVLNLIDVLPKSIDLPSSTKLQSLPLTEQIKEISKYVVLVKVK